MSHRLLTAAAVTVMTVGIVTGANSLSPEPVPAETDAELITVEPTPEEVATVVPVEVVAEPVEVVAPEPAAPEPTPTPEPVRVPGPSYWEGDWDGQTACADPRFDAPDGSGCGMSEIVRLPVTEFVPVPMVEVVLVPCLDEVASGGVNCYWDASERGDGQGEDFVFLFGTFYTPGQ